MRSAKEKSYSLHDLRFTRSRRNENLNFSEARNYFKKVSHVIIPQNDNGEKVIPMSFRRKTVFCMSS